MRSFDRQSTSADGVVQSLNLSAGDKRWIIDSLVEAEHLGPVRNAEQYDAYKRAAAALEEQAVAHGIPVRTLATADAAARERWLAWTRTFAGTMLNAIDAAILAWDEEHA